jgi:hypothetical protein
MNTFCLPSQRWRRTAWPSGDDRFTASSPASPWICGCRTDWSGEANAFRA